MIFFFVKNKTSMINDVKFLMVNRILKRVEFFDIIELKVEIPPFRMGVLGFYLVIHIALSMKFFEYWLLLDSSFGAGHHFCFLTGNFHN